MSVDPGQKMTQIKSQIKGSKGKATQNTFITTYFDNMWDNMWVQLMNIFDITQKYS